MAVRSNTNGRLSRASNLPVNSTGWTMCCWTRITATEASVRVLMGVEGASPLFGYLGVDSGASSLRWWYDAGAGFSDTAVVTLTTGTWYFVAIRMISATQVEILHRADGAGSLSTTGVLTIVSTTWEELQAMGTNVAGEEWSNGEVRALKLWHAALSSTEILAESFQEPPVRTANVDSYLSLLDATDAGDDESGNARDWTVTGTFATVGSSAAIAGTLAGLTASASLAANKPITIGASLAGLTAAASLAANKPITIAGGLAGLVASLQMEADGGGGPSPSYVRRPRDRMRGREMRWRG